MQVLITDTKMPNSLANETDRKLRSIVDDINNVLKTVTYDGHGDGVGVDDTTAVKTAASESAPNKSSLSPLSPLSPSSKPEDHTPFPGISRLTSTLYLCGAAAVVPEYLTKLDVRLVVNVAPELPDTPLPSANPPMYLRINAQDRSEVDLAAHFDEVADLIEDVRLSGGGATLVHCVAGVSRSASLCLAYLMKYGGMNLRDSYELVKSKRPQVRPNSGFFQQLRRFDEQLNGLSSVQMVYFASLDKEIPDILEPEYRAMEDFYQRYRSSLRKR